MLASSRAAHHVCQPILARSIALQLRATTGGFRSSRNFDSPAQARPSWRGYSTGSKPLFANCTPSRRKQQGQGKNGEQGAKAAPPTSTPRKAKDSRPFKKQYPPPEPLPKMVTYDQPSVPNPIETEKAWQAYRTNLKIAVPVLVLLLAAGGFYWGSTHIYNDGPLIKGAELSPEEMEKKVQAAQAGSGKGSYAMLAIKRSSVIATAVGSCVWDYRKTLNRKYASKEEEAEALRDCHLRSAQRVLKALQTNGGLYIKLGQHMSAVMLLPLEWTDTLKPLQDQNTPTPLPELEAMFRTETGMTFNDAFSEVDAKPIGVASLAQVHRAVDRKTGEALAIKLMHPEVERFSEVDMETVTTLVKWVKRVFPQFEFSWLADEMRENMPLEMNFCHEAENAARAEADFANYRRTSVYVPKVRYVTKRVMAMQYIDGARPDNLAFLAEHNIDRNRVSQELSRIFSQMLYVHGWFHGDPHGGNILIRPAPKGSRSKYNFEVVLLDHGLYFEFPSELRANYARFWLALLQQSTPAVQAQRRDLARKIANIDDELYPILESAITGRSGLEGSDPENTKGVKGGARASSLLDLPTGTGMSEDEQEHIRKTVLEKEGLFTSILDLLRRVPRRMLMVLKLNDLTRSLDANLHTTHGSTRPFVIAARYCALVVWDSDRANLKERWNREGLTWGLIKSWVGAWYNYAYFYRGLALLESFSDLSARSRKILSYTKALAAGNSEKARRAASGVEEQERRLKEGQGRRDIAKNSVEKEDG